MNKYNTFNFGEVDFDASTGELRLHYSYEEGPEFTEVAKLPPATVSVDQNELDDLLKYLHIIAGTSYYKAYYSPNFKHQYTLSPKEAEMFNALYAGGLSEFMYTNKLSSSEIAKFVPNTHVNIEDQKNLKKNGNHKAKSLLLSSGGKDSLLSAELLLENGSNFDKLYISSDGAYPSVLNKIEGDVLVTQRKVDVAALRVAPESLNGHVPFSAIIAGYASLVALLNGYNEIIASNERSADESTVSVGEWQVNHMFSKTSQAEKLMNWYIAKSTGIEYFSLLRTLGEVEVAELFAEKAWVKYGHHFSSCNLANYKQGNDSSDLSWDGTCSKCVNSWLLLAPFVAKTDLLEIFNNKNLSKDPTLQPIFKQILGLTNEKPFECVGAIDEMRQAYVLATEKDQDFVVDGIDSADLEITNEIIQIDYVHQRVKEILNEKRN